MAKILIVENDDANRTMIARRLEWEGYQVITAGDGAQAIMLARSDRPDLILMDLGLPVLSGWQAVQRIKTAADTRSIPIIALTAYVMAEDRAKAIGVGCEDFESKPVDFPRLLANIQALLQRVFDGT